MSVNCNVVTNCNMGVGACIWTKPMPPVSVKIMAFLGDFGMGEVVSCERFLALRAAGQALRGAQSLREIAESAQRLHDAVQQSCDAALGVIEGAIATATAQTLFLKHANARYSKAMESGDLERLIAERDAILEALDRDCRNCNGFSPFEPESCCEDRKPE